MLYLKSISRSDRRCSLFVVFFVAWLLWTFASLFVAFGSGVVFVAHRKIAFVSCMEGLPFFRSLWCVVWLCHLFGLKSWLYSWLVVKMSRCWSCFKPSTCEDRIRSDLRQGLCNKCFRSLSCHRCHACVQRPSPRMIEFLHIPGL